jgi:hypothetical protein
MIFGEHYIVAFADPLWLFDSAKYIRFNYVSSEQVKNQLTCTPATAQSTKIAPSKTRNALSTSIVKST